MRSQFLIALFITLVGWGVYWYQSSANECPVPLYYSIGEIDPSFDLSEEEVLAYIKSAEQLWEEDVGRELFSYKENALFSVNFVFDERQEVANSEQQQRAELDAQKEKNDEVMDAVDSLQNEYQSLSSIYEERALSYESKLAAYNADVTKYNDRGGAPPEVFENLQIEREVLNEEAASLSETANELNALATEINRLGERGNQLVQEYNQSVNQYNTQFGFEREFTQGDYQRSEINIYKFSSDNELITVLGHELGHALGIGHVEEDSSLMYYLLEDTSRAPVLSAEDLHAYREVCGVEESFGQKVRRVIRESLQKF